MLKNNNSALLKFTAIAASQPKPAICIVIPYFGIWPFWMPFFLESCRANGSIQWLLYTDCGIPDNCPTNVSIQELSFEQYCNRISTELNINFKPNNAYKLCDIKPALGQIHAQELQDFDFWGFGDIDLIYGNLRKYFTADRLKKKDIFSTHQSRIGGHLCLIRNTQEMRAAFTRVKNWQNLFESGHVAFDEKAFSKVFLRHKNSPRWIRKLAAIVDPWLTRAEFVEAYSTPHTRILWTDGTRKFPSRWYWSEGRLTNDIDGEKEFPYLHFLAWKKGWIEKECYLSSPQELWKQGFEISANGFSF